MKDWNKVFTNDEQKRLERRLVAKQKNALDRGIECSLNMVDMFLLGTKLLGHGKCDYTDLGFSTLIAGSNGQPDHPKYPTIERIDDTKGYVRGNVCVVMQRANQLKDNLVDKRTATTIIDPIDREIVKAMMLNMSRDHLDALKTKYIPDEDEDFEETEMNCSTREWHHAETEHNQCNQPIDDLVVVLPGQKTSGEEPGVAFEPVKGPEGLPGKNPVVDVPDDVAIATAYAKYCTDFAAAGMKVSVTYAQFKAKYIRKTCALTDEPLNKEPKFILVLNLEIGFAKDNFIIVGDKIGKAITTMMIQTGLSVPRITALLNRAV